MTLSFNPHISNDFTALVMKGDHVRERLAAIDLSDEEKLVLARNIIITAFTMYDVDINDLINHVKKSARKAA